MAVEQSVADLNAQNANLRAEIDKLREERDSLCAELERFRDFASCASEWRWEMGPDLRMASITEQYCAASGLRTENLIGKRRDEIGNFEPGNQALARHMADLQARRPFRNFEYCHIDDDGVAHYFSTSGNPVFGADGAFLGYRGIARDITERKRGELELQESRLLTQTVMDAIPFKFILKDVQGRYLQINRAFAATYGRDLDEVIGKPTQDVVPAEFAKVFIERDRTVLRENRSLETEERALRPDGSVGDFLTIRFPVRDAGGKVKGLGLVAMDITERKAVERALKEREYQLRSITENLPVLIVRFDSEKRYVFASRIAEEWYARPMPEIIGKRIPDIFGPGAFEAVASHVETVFSGQTTHFEGPITYPDGIRREMEITFVPDRAADGSVQGWFALALDVSELKQTQRALRDSEEQLRIVTDHLPALIVRFDKERRISLVNRTAEQWYARPASEILGKRVAELLGDEVGERFAPHLGWALAGQNVSFEVNIPYPDGVCRDIEATYVPDRAPDGTVQGVFALIQDGTARKAAEKARRESEARMSAILDNSPAAIYLKDLNSRFLLANREYLKWYGFGPEDVVGKTSFDLFPEQLARSFVAQDQAVIEQRSVVSREEQAALDDGSRRAVVITKFPVYDGDGELIAVGGVDMDITAVKRLEADLLRKERLAAMGQLTGTVAHELRNPLGAVAMSLGAIRKRCEAAGLDLDRALARATRGIERSDRIVTDLLDFARARGLQRAPTAPDVWLDELLDEHGVPAGIELVRRRQANGVTLDIDAEWLRRAVVNVLDNACQALAGQPADEERADAPTVTVSTHTAGRRYFLSIEDNGPGIRADILPMVTEPLVSTKSFGTGLGLPTVKRIMEDHGGGLEIENIPAGGARVTLWLPMDDSAAQQA